ncbi:hypothetical protein SYNTR_1964 [Candidatus Syntrophocurvum alkaliphilum]|uniref:Uncharacterized protein n=1 Tax=Candidatus Syntrophocurvum alkaliphilum TaxID=2293317 RepID=A0A6I6DNP4_9FIRM|nr:hypothetical protein [Candidatus Syntrophocurvum alkaliphilum]QGU00558.1 hypothetical protein SYNTR_1964 [Candidatus Syntrophocurvum alkaliphilum]
MFGKNKNRPMRLRAKRECLKTCKKNNEFRKGMRLGCNYRRGFENNLNIDSTQLKTK